MFSIKNYFLIVSILLVFICQFEVLAYPKGKSKSNVPSTSNNPNYTQEQILAELSKIYGTSNTGSLQERLEAMKVTAELNHEILEIIQQIDPNFDMSTLTVPQREQIKNIIQNTEKEDDQIEQIRQLLQQQ